MSARRVGNIQTDEIIRGVFKKDHANTAKRIHALASGHVDRRKAPRGIASLVAAI